MRYRVVFNAHAARAFRKLPQAVKERLRPAIDALADNPRPFGVEKMSGVKDTYRIRVGGYRVLYEIQRQRLVVLVVEIGPRGDVYRRR